MPFPDHRPDPWWQRQRRRLRPLGRPKSMPIRPLQALLIGATGPKLQALLAQKQATQRPIPRIQLDAAVRCFAELLTRNITQRAAYCYPRLRFLRPFPGFRRSRALSATSPASSPPKSPGIVAAHETVHGLSPANLPPLPPLSHRL